jgi:hypothetical protein
MEALKALRAARTAPAVKEEAAPAIDADAPAIDPKIKAAADRWARHEKVLAEKVKSAEGKVPAAFKAAWDLAADDVQVRAALVDAFSAATAAPTPVKEPAKSAGTSTPKGPTVDFDAAIRKGEIAEAKQKDPIGFKAYMENLLKR